MAYRKITKDMVDTMLNIIEKSALFTDCACKSSWVSGCSTNVAPITCYEHVKEVFYEIEIQLSNSDLRKVNPRMRKLRDEIDKVYPYVIYHNTIIKYDGSCPNVVRFYVGKPFWVHN